MDDKDIAVTREDVEEVTKQDKNLAQLLKDVAPGKLSTQLQSMAYSTISEEIFVKNNILLKEDRIILPPKLIEMILKMSHQSHGLGV